MPVTDVFTSRHLDAPWLNLACHKNKLIQLDTCCQALQVMSYDLAKLLCVNGLNC